MDTAKSNNISSRKRLAYLFFIVLLLFLYLLAGVYPLQFTDISREQVNNGALLTSEHVLQLRSPGIAYTIESPTWLPLAVATYDLEIILEVRAASLEQSGPARIFTYSLNTGLRNLTIGQEGSSLIVRIRNCLTSLNGIPGYIIKDVFTDNDWHHIRILVSSASLEVYINGNVIFKAPLSYQHLQSWNSSYRLALGNEITGDRPWLGDIRSAVVRVGDKSFDYLSPDALAVPHTYTVMHSSELEDRNVILLPFFRNQNYRASLEDWEINFINFVPFGWLLVLYRKPRPGILFAVVLTAAVSATIELSQLVFTFDRIPSTEDFILNTLGGGVGAWLAQHYVITIRRRSVKTG